MLEGRREKEEGERGGNIMFLFGFVLALGFFLLVVFIIQIN